jgi:hypothetical protein
MGSLNVKEPSPVDRKRRLSRALGFGRVQRRPELDALRGIFLISAPCCPSQRHMGIVTVEQHVSWKKTVDRIKKPLEE